MTLVAFEGGPFGPLERAADERGVPLRIVRQDRALRDRYGAAPMLVRPDQHVAWCADCMPDDVAGLIDQVRGAGRTGGGR
jgi:hypothetical protein